MKKFLIIRMSSLGDIIHTLPAFAALRGQHPEAEITWLVEKAGKAVLDLVPGLSRIVSLDLKNKNPFGSEYRKELSRVRSLIRDRNQTSLDFQGLMKSGFFSWMSSSRTRIGFARKNLREPAAALFYNRRLHAISESDHVIHKNLKLLECIDIHSEKLEFPLNIPQSIRDRLHKKLEDSGCLSSPSRVVLNVGAAWETKRLPADNWIKTAGILMSHGYSPLILWGTPLERNLAEEISRKTGTPAAPPLDLQEVIALLSIADLVITGDTFALQAACALRRPVVALFGPTSPRRNGPFSERDQVIFNEFDCSHCYKRHCSGKKCILAINPELVAEAGLRLLETNDNI